MADSHISHWEMLGQISDTSKDGNFCKRRTYRKDIDTINKHFANQLELHISGDERPVGREWDVDGARVELEGNG